MIVPANGATTRSKDVSSSKWRTLAVLEATAASAAATAACPVLTAATLWSTASLATALSVSAA